MVAQVVAFSVPVSGLLNSLLKPMEFPGGLSCKSADSQYEPCGRVKWYAVGTLSPDRQGMIQKVTIGDAMLIHGDCQEWLAAVPQCFRVDAVVTDPFYGVGIDYGSFPDTPEQVKAVAVPVIERCRQIASCVALTSGNKHAWMYPKPDDVGVWFNPAGTGFGKFGFCLAHLILYYGKDPKPNKSASSVTGAFDRQGESGHPCPKPIAFMRWLVDKTSLAGNTVLDPFMGSGTTGEACIQTGRKFIGVELERKYFDIACERIDQAQRQVRLCP